MALPTESEKAALQQAILAQLTPTPFACTAPLEALINGTTNFVFRGQLVTPRQDGARSVIIKHATDYAAVNKDFPWMCRDLKGPRLFWFDRATNTQVLEDFPDAVDLKAMLLSSVGLPSSERLGHHPLARNPALGRSIGVALGAWLRTFHKWTSAPEPARAALRRAIAANEPMRRLKRQITYDALVRVVSQYSDVLGDSGPILEAVQAMAAKEFEKVPLWRTKKKKTTMTGASSTATSGRESDILLLSEDHLWLDVDTDTTPQKLFVVDWEFSQYGHRAYDIGQLVGDLIERDHFRGAAASLDVLGGFVSGYGFPMGSDDGESSSENDDRKNRLAFRVAIHAGVQLIGCFIRRAPDGPLPGTPEQVQLAMRLGTDLVVKAGPGTAPGLRAACLPALFI